MVTPRRPPGRYDEPRPLPRALLLSVAAVSGALLLALVYLAFDRYSQGRVRFAVQGYRVLGEESVQVSFEVHKAPEDAVVCRVRALDRDGVEVGSDDVRVGPAKTDTVTTVHTLTTSHRAATADVSVCLAATPSASPSAP